jgi:hypothetical protein
MNICKQREKKVWKTKKFLIFSKSKGHNFVKNQWIKAKLKLNLYLGMAKQWTKYQMNMRKLDVSSRPQMPPHALKVLLPCLIFSTIKGDKVQERWLCQKSTDHNQIQTWPVYSYEESTHAISISNKS